MPPIESALTPRTPIAQVRPATTQGEQTGVERVTPPTLEAAVAVTSLRESVSSAALQPVIETTFAALQEIRPGESSDASQLALDLSPDADAATRIVAFDAFEAASQLETSEISPKAQAQLDAEYEAEVEYFDSLQLSQQVARAENSPGADIIEASQNVFTGVDVRV